MTDSEPFRLQNPPPKPKPAEFDDHDKDRQRTLFAGLDCLPGQRDLFSTEGPTTSGEPGHDR